MHYECLDFSCLVSRSSIKPSSWNVANVVPIHKKISRSALSNYPLISLLPISSKVMETIEKRYSNLSPCEFSFRGGLSTADFLTNLHHECSKSLARGRAVALLAIYIAGAFDKVSHPGTVDKAKYYGRSGPLHTWVRNDLENRQLMAVVGSQSSTPHDIRAGVPPGRISTPHYIYCT